MALLPKGKFNANEIDPKSGFAPIPPGDYLVVITDSEMKKTNDGEGEYLKLSFKVVHGEFEGRYIWLNLNLVNKSAQAVEIAERELSAICHAVGVLEPEDSQELHGIVMLAKVKVKPPANGYDASNTLGNFRPASEYDEAEESF